jgi:hypothetical protein
MPRAIPITDSLTGYGVTYGGSIFENLLPDAVTPRLVLFLRAIRQNSALALSGRSRGTTETRKAFNCRFS